mmetsp:Transcript_57947/g.168024  ORF Transcript_57947/g.168024 Transcript_57947/m.168024 type:complete len:213 (+) Transcript_57947:555-1193(+)
MSSFGASCRASILVKPSHCSTIVATGLSAAPCSDCRCWPTFKQFSRQSRATPTILESWTDRSCTIGLMAPLSTMYSICCGAPPEVALLIVQAASFLTSKSSPESSLITLGMMPLLMISWICSRFPAAMLDIVQHASFRIAFFEELRRLKREGSAPLWRMTCVWWSSPVTMLPTTRSAGVCTSGEVCSNNSTSRRHTPAWMTAVIRSLGPSER